MTLTACVGLVLHGGAAGLAWHLWTSPDDPGGGEGSTIVAFGLTIGLALTFPPMVLGAVLWTVGALRDRRDRRSGGPSVESS